MGTSLNTKITWHELFLAVYCRHAQDRPSRYSRPLASYHDQRNRSPQDIEYILSFFGKRLGKARKKYRSYVEKVVDSVFLLFQLDEDHITGRLTYLII